MPDCPDTATVLHHHEGDVNDSLVFAVAELLEIEPLEIRAHRHLTFVQLGGSSVQALQLTFKLDALGLFLDLESVLNGDNSIDILSQLLSSSDDAKETSTHVRSNRLRSHSPLRPFELASPRDHGTVLQEASEQIGCSLENIEDILPLTCQQRALWLGSLKQQGAYISHWRYALPVSWNTERLKQAWLKLLQWTPALRLRVVLGPDETLYQAVTASVIYNAPRSETDGNARECIIPEYGSPLVAAGIENQTEIQELHIYAHHVVYDRWSMKLIMNDLRRLYHHPDVQISRPSFLPFLKPVVQDARDEFLSRWREFLGDTSLTPGPDLVQPETMPCAVQKLDRSIEVPSGGSATKAELIAAAWSLVCSKHCNSHDVSFGITLWGRDAPVQFVEDMAFPTFLTLPFCARLVPGETIIELLRKTKLTLGILRRVQMLGLEEISSVNKVSKQACRFNSIVVVQPELENGSMARGDFELISWDIKHPHPLVLECTPTNNQIIFSLHHDPRYLPTVAAEHLLSHLCIAVGDLSIRNDTICDEVDLFTTLDAERIRSWVVPCEELNKSKLHTLIEEQAKSTPSADAIWTTKATMTYFQLMESARQLAGQLEIRNATGHVGFCIEKSALAIVVMIAINMSGCAFVPMDPSNPSGRLEQIIEDSDMGLLLCSSSLTAKFADSRVAVLTLDSTGLLSRNGVERGECNDKSDTAYIIYTSGSTGTPKGVVISHQQVCTSVSAMKKTFGFSPRTRALQFSSYAFDACIMEIYVTLAAGGVICVPNDAERLELDDFIQQSEPTFSILTTSVALTLSDKSMAQFSRLVLTGEALSKSVLRKAFEAGTEVWCGYGPTETTVIVMQHRFPSADVSPFNIGRSFSSTAWIVDSHEPHKLAPVGVPGELAFSGHTLAKGYYKDTEKTDKAYRKNLKWTQDFPGHPLERVYLTGDLARYNPDGSIEYLGRSGGYTKIAGNRVDLAEIEHVLMHNGKLSEVSVQICHMQGQNTSREILLCFFVESSCKDHSTCRLLDLNPQARSRATEAQSILKSSLPSYMMPSAFVLVSCIPLAISGKMDKNRLHDLVKSLDVDRLLVRYDLMSSDDESAFTATNGAFSEEKIKLLVNSWAKVLSVTASSLKSNSHFFRMGGDSLRAMKLAAALRRAGVSLKVSEIFKAPVLQDMAASLGPQNDVVQEQALARFYDDREYAELVKSAAQTLHVSESSIESIMPCISLQVQMLVASERVQSAFTHRECFELDTDVSQAEITNVCRTLVEQNELLRTRMTVHGPSGRFLQAVLDCNAVFTMESYDMTLKQFLEQSPMSGMGLGTSLCDFAILKAGNRRLLMWDMHHSIYDGHSRLLLLKRLQELITQHRHNPSVDLGSAAETPNVPYQRFVQYIASIDKRRARKFWSQYLEGSERLSLGILRTVAGGSATNARASRKIDLAWKKTGFTPASSIRAAFAIVLAQYAGQSDVNFAVTVNGRDAPVVGIDEIAGPTFSTVPVRVKIDHRDLMRTLLSRVQQDSADCLTHQHLPTEVISGLSTSCKLACDFTCHLLIQLAESEPPYESLRSLGYRALEEMPPMSLQIPFNLVVTADNDGVVLEAIYNDASIQSREVELFLDQIGAILKQMSVAASDATIGDVSCIGKLNAQTLMSLQPSPNAHHTINASIPDLIFHSLSEKRNHEALYSTEISFTYQEIYDLAHYFAHQISEKVKKPQQLLATCFRKSALGVIAQLAILIAGHAYVPIDPHWPAARRNDILFQTQSPLIVTSPELATVVSNHNTEQLILDSDTDIDSSGAEVSSEIMPSDAAYVIFTSGSTGSAKGVVVEHGSICQILQEYVKRLDFTSHTRALLFASFTFDASVLETWSVLAAGGALCIADDNERINDLAGFITRSRCDFIGLTPTAAGLFEPKQITTVKTILFCGEKCRVSDLQRWQDNHVVLINAYGPTEVSVNAIMNTRFRNTDIDDVGTSMGGGLWIVEPGNCHHFLPVGCTGELMISGPVLAREYLNAPDMTSKKFVRPNWPKWTRMSDGRAYMTGDLVRLDSRGRLHFVGRNDGQMKVNGTRIEAEEIESAVRQCDVSIKDVIAGSLSHDGSNELALYFVPINMATEAGPARVLLLTDEYADAISAMHLTASEKLPASHVPAIYIPISCIPFSTSGKADRKLLAQLTSLLHKSQLNLYHPFLDDEYVAGDKATKESSNTNGTAEIERPLSELEAILKSLWELALPHSLRTAVTAQSHFSQCGGDSIAAIRLAAAAKSRGYNLPVNVVFANPRLRDMATAIDKRPSLAPRASSIQSPGAFELLDGLALSPAVSTGSPEIGRNGSGGDGGSRKSLTSDYFGSCVR